MISVNLVEFQVQKIVALKIDTMLAVMSSCVGMKIRACKCCYAPNSLNGGISNEVLLAIAKAVCNKLGNLTETLRTVGTCHATSIPLSTT